MGIRHSGSVAIGLVLLGGTPLRAQDVDDPTRAVRWGELEHAIFGARPVQDGTARMALEAPVRALDAALVPLTVTLSGDKPIKSVYVIIDDNPAPLAAHVSFGPQSDPHTLKMRVRVNAYTNIHAVAETADGELYSVAKFVKAAGGCSAPAGADDQEALQNLGKMRFKLLQPFVAGKPLQGQLMIRHPNFNGMQMNQLTRMFTPARYIRSIDVEYGAAQVLHVDSDISLSTDPVITFGFTAQKPGQLDVRVTDTADAQFDQKFDVPAPAS